MGEGGAPDSSSPSPIGYLFSVPQARQRSADFSPQRSAHRKDAAECSGGGGTFERCCGLKSALRRLACGTLKQIIPSDGRGEAPRPIPPSPSPIGWERGGVRGRLLVLSLVLSRASWI